MPHSRWLILANFVFVVCLSCAHVTGVTQVESTITCLRAKVECEQRIPCGKLYERIGPVCGPSIYSCETKHVAECYGLLLMLQDDVNFRRCTCDEIDQDATECLRVQKTIFRHTCLSTRFSGRPRRLDVTLMSPTYWATPATTTKRQLKSYENSCIKLRKHCLNSTECAQVLHNYRKYCAEKRRHGKCVAHEKRKCLKAIQDIKPTGLLDCQCDMRKESALGRCMLIQKRIANNTCLATIPYLVHSTSQSVHPTLTERGVNDNTIKSNESTCVDALNSCKRDATCRQYKVAYDAACAWDDVRSTCVRHACMMALRKFYTHAPRDKAYALHFCRCDAGDDKCAVIRKKLRPTCIQMELPPPSCDDIVTRCRADTDCSIRLGAYKSKCRFDSKLNRCSATAQQCRAAMLGIMGTVLTVNCTCATNDVKCRENRDSMLGSNRCTEQAIVDYHDGGRTVQDGPSARHRVANTHTKETCRRRLAKYVPLFMNAPAVIRTYDKTSNCSKVCFCLENGTFYCEEIRCNHNLACHYQNGVYGHGSYLTDEIKRLCLCIKGEMVCAKPPQLIKIKSGFFLHVGYSVAEMFLVEHASGKRMRFEPWKISDKLSTLLNGDSAEQFCKLKLFSQHDGNLVFDIQSTSLSKKDSPQDSCIQAARLLCDKINNRHNVIISSADLSILKVSQLGGIEFHQPKPTPGQRSSACASHASYYVILTSVLFRLTLLRL